MFKCVISKFINCEGQIVTQYIPHLVNAVNKLCHAVGDAGKEIPYEENVDLPREAMESSVRKIKEVAGKLDAQRLERVADEDAARDERAEMDGLNRKLERQNSELRIELDVQNESARVAVEKRRELALSLIRFRDQLLYFEDEFSGSGNDQAIKLLGSLYKETGRFMAGNDVEPLEESGIFDAERHIISGTEATDNPELNDTIAGTSQVGYRIDGELYRRQEVVVYVSNGGA